MGEAGAEVLENDMTQRAFNKAVETLDGSLVMKPFEAAWDILPAWAQEGYVHPVSRAAMGTSLPGIGAMWFDKLAKSGLLKMKKGEGKEVSPEQKINKFAAEAGKIATGGEASGIIDMVLRVVNAQEKLMEGARKHLDRVHAEKERHQEFAALETSDKAVSGKKISSLRKGIERTAKRKA